MESKSKSESKTLRMEKQDQKREKGKSDKAKVADEKVINGQRHSNKMAKFDGETKKNVLFH